MVAGDGQSWHIAPRLDAFLTQGAVIYGAAVVVIGLMFANVGGAAWIGLAYAVISIGVSVLYYNPVVMPERDPGLVDWVEDLVFTGLFFVAAALLILEVAGRTLM